MKAPIAVMKPDVIGAASYIADVRQIKNTPAVTIVAAWIKAETGVGPSIASGNQTWSKNCADLPIAPINSRAAISSNALISNDKNESLLSLFSIIELKTVSKLTEPKTKKTVITPKARPTSPTLFVTKALIEAALAVSFLK